MAVYICTHTKTSKDFQQESSCHLRRPLALKAPSPDLDTSITKRSHRRGLNEYQDPFEAYLRYMILQL